MATAALNVKDNMVRVQVQNRMPPCIFECSIGSVGVTCTELAVERGHTQ